MSRWHHWWDWVGGWTFQIVRPKEILDFCRKRGFELIRLSICGEGHGKNEFVFRRATGS